MGIAEEQRWMIGPAVVFGGLLAACIVLWLKKHRLPSALVLGGSLLLFAVVAPSMKPARFEARRNACIANLRTIAQAKEDWVRRYPELARAEPTVEQLTGTNGFFKHFPACPGGGVYSIGKPDQPATCSLAVKGHVFVP